MVIQKMLFQMNSKIEQIKSVWDEKNDLNYLSQSGMEGISSWKGIQPSRKVDKCISTQTSDSELWKLS